MGYQAYSPYQSGGVIVDLASIEDGKTVVERTKITHGALPEDDDYNSTEITTYWGLRPENINFSYENDKSKIFVCCKGSQRELDIEVSRKELFSDNDFTHGVSISPFMPYMTFKGIYQLAFPKNYIPKSISIGESTKLVHAEIYNDIVVMTWLFSSELEVLAVGKYTPIMNKIKKHQLYTIPSSSEGVAMNDIYKKAAEIGTNSSVIKGVIEGIAKIFS